MICLTLIFNLKLHIIYIRKIKFHFLTIKFNVD